MFKRTNLKRGGGAGDGKASKYHTKKDGTKPGKGTVTDKALKDSAKTAKV